MRGRTGIVLINTILILIAILGIHYIKSSDYEKADIAELNKTYMNVLEELQTNVEPIIEELEKKYACDIIMVSDKNYTQIMYHAIKNGYVVFDLLEEDLISGKIIFEGGSVTYSKLKGTLTITMCILIVLVMILYNLGVFVLYYYYIRPFKKMKSFASEVAKGNLDVPLRMNKHNYFGVFTESFDVMREELKVARQRECEANLSKKELVASLSHDMKTPIATIQASCEVLMIKLRGNDNIDKIHLINERANMINSLINNMFHATLEELEELEVNAQEELSTIINEIFEKVRYIGNINVINSCPECLITVDQLRFTQVVDNIVNNSMKYAGSPIDISFSEVNNGVVIKIKDYGPGVEEESLPLLAEKFYRAGNTKGITGAGLGMYLADYFMKKMKGAMEYYNEDGFAVELFLRKV